MSLRNLYGFAAHIVLSGLLALGAGWIAERVVLRVLDTVQTQYLHSYAELRGEWQQSFFDDALQLNRAAERVFLDRLAAFEGEDVSAEFDRLFPVMPDGTRRSHASLFDGVQAGDGSRVYGIGAFLGDGAAMSEEEQRRYLAGFHAVRIVGEAHLDRFSSLYYFTPDRRMVMFAPNRPDRLEFYRITAPADFPLEADEDPLLFSRDTNPRGEMQCTPLSRFVYEDGGERAASACRMPMRVGRELAGAFGTSVLMDDYLMSALEKPPANGANLLLDSQGSVLAREDSEQHVAIDLDAVLRLTAEDPRPFGVFRDTGSGNLVAFARIRQPNWLFLSVMDHRVEAGIAHTWAWHLAGIIFGLSLLTAVVRGVVARLRPMRRLIRWQRQAAANDPYPEIIIRSPKDSG